MDHSIIDTGVCLAFRDWREVPAFGRVFRGVGILFRSVFGFTSQNMEPLAIAEHAAELPAEPAAPRAAADAETRTVYGSVLIADRGMTAGQDAQRRQRVRDCNDSSCVAPSGSDDFVAGGDVQVLGPSGVLATGEIQVGDWQSGVMSANGVVGCRFPIVIEGVPTGLDEYGIHVGDASRPAVTRVPGRRCAWCAWGVGLLGVVGRDAGREVGELGPELLRHGGGGGRVGDCPGPADR